MKLMVLILKGSWLTIEVSHLRSIVYVEDQ